MAVIYRTKRGLKIDRPGQRKKAAPKDGLSHKIRSYAKLSAFRLAQQRQQEQRLHQ